MRSLRLGLSRFMRVSWKVRPTWDHIKTVSYSKLYMQNGKKLYLFCYSLLAEVLEIGVVEVHEGVLEGSDHHGTILKQFLFQNCTCKMDKKLIFVLLYITCWGPWGRDCRGSWGSCRTLWPLWKPSESKFYKELCMKPIEIDFFFFDVWKLLSHLT